MNEQMNICQVLILFGADVKRKYKNDLGWKMIIVVPGWHRTSGKDWQHSIGKWEIQKQGLELEKWRNDYIFVGMRK